MGYLVPSGFIWNRLGSSRIIWDHMGPSTFIWDRLGSSGMIRDDAESSGIIWKHVGSCGMMLDCVGSWEIISGFHQAHLGDKSGRRNLRRGICGDSGSSAETSGNSERSTVPWEGQISKSGITLQPLQKFFPTCNITMCFETRYEQASLITIESVQGWMGRSPQCTKCCACAYKRTLKS